MWGLWQCIECCLVTCAFEHAEARAMKQSAESTFGNSRAQQCANAENLRHSGTRKDGDRV